MICPICTSTLDPAQTYTNRSGTESIRCPYCASTINADEARTAAEIRAAHGAELQKRCQGNGKVSKRSNEYADAIDPDVFERLPKTVIAAIAVSFCTTGGDRIEEATGRILAEWQILHNAGIVPQAPPAKWQSREIED